jgi:hypothetical protein
METNEIIESGFIKAFMEGYYEERIHSYFPDKDRLIYAICSTELEKNQASIKQIKIVKKEIRLLGYEGLSQAYLVSCKPQSTVNYVKPENRFTLWLNIFCENFIDSIVSFQPILDTYKRLEKSLPDEYTEATFWSLYPLNDQPIEKCMPFIIQLEADLVWLINQTISEFKKEGSWEFDFEDYERYKEISKPLQNLFNISELLVQLNRLEMFRELAVLQTEAETNIIEPEAKKAKSDKLKAKLKKYGFYKLTSVNQLSEMNKQKLVELINSKPLPYRIAMFDNLGFLRYLAKEHFLIKHKLYKEVSLWFNSDKDGRAVKGNISSLLPNTTENLNRYTAHNYKETVKKDYENLK